MEIEVLVRRLQNFPADWQLPQYGTPGSAAVDLRNAGETVTLRPFERMLIPTGLAIALPRKGGLNSGHLGSGRVGAGGGADPLLRAGPPSEIMSRPRVSLCRRASSSLSAWVTGTRSCATRAPVAFVPPHHSTW